MLQISASLLAADYAHLGREVQRAELAGVDSFHFDLMDGHYVPNLALSPDHLAALRKYTSLPFHTHLELSNPHHVLERFEPFPADVIVVQWNTLADPIEAFRRIRLRKAGAGLGLHPDDHIDEIAGILADIDLLLILGVDPGFGGQAMQPGTVEKIRAARALADARNPSLIVAIDGGVKPANAAALAGAGADCLIMGTALFRAGDMKQVVAEIRGSASGLSRR